jgi:hypothetical protein
MLGLDARLVRVSNLKSLKGYLNTKRLKISSRLVPWVNGVKWSETNGLERLKLKDKRIRI